MDAEEDDDLQAVIDAALAGVDVPDDARMADNYEATADGYTCVV